MLALAPALLLALAAQVPQQAPDPGPAAVPLYDNLGSHHLPVSTRVPAAQSYFDQGLRLYYAFNHQEAVRAFREAQRLDPECAMCWWGEALAWGPNINLPMDSAGGVAAYAAVTRAVAVKAGGTPVERALIDALATRYTAVPAADRASLDSAYSRAMAGVTARFPEYAEAAVLYAESQMDLRPWRYWTEDGQLQPGMTEALAKLESVIAQNPQHPGACHFFIHAVEAVQPERAVACAERLASLMPGAGHLVHMPGHIYIRVGRYADAIRANEHAVHADESYIRDQQPAAGVYTVGYYPHNYDFLAFAASLAGRSRQGVDAADRAASLIVPDLLHAPGMAFLQHYMTRPLQLRVRFGLWDEILRAPAPPADLPHATAMWRYARGRALAAKSDLPAAEAELKQLQAAATSAELKAVKLEFNLSQDVLNVAVHTLAGHIAAGRRDFAGAADHLAEAARLESALTYGEPPEWTVPVRQELGEVLLSAGRAADAERVFREDLKRFPANGWSLHGLVRALKAQQKTDEAAVTAAQFERAWQSADVRLTALED